MSEHVHVSATIKMKQIQHKCWLGCARLWPIRLWPVRLWPNKTQSRGGFTRQPENSKREHFRAPAFKNTTKIPRKDPQEREERMIIVAGGGKKSEILGGPAEGRSGRGGPGEGGGGSGEGGGGSGRTNSMPGCWRGNWQPPEVAQPTKVGHSHEILGKVTKIWSTTAKNKVELAKVKLAKLQLANN